MRGPGFEGRWSINSRMNTVNDTALLRIKHPAVLLGLALQSAETVAADVGWHISLW